MESIRVYLRIRPFSQAEQLSESSQFASAALNPPSSQGSRASFSVSATPGNNGPAEPSLFLLTPPNAVTMQAVSGTLGMMAAKQETFTFDYVGGPATEQRDMFDSVGRSIVDRCLEGYNGTIFAYGQTGSGKTYTMQGAGPLTNLDNDRRGLIPRCMEYLFRRIAERSADSDRPTEYLVKASYLEIYNESIHDLLDPATPMRALREDINRGIFVDGITEETILTPTDAYRVFERGATNRHVGSTAMNRESSRSHSVLTLIIQSKTTEGDLVDIREARFNLVDLAGSERQKTAGTTGQRLKEAANINKSLSALGSVINALVESSNGKLRHVHYRDSKLTFLLRDSLGGNSITWIIANASPATINAAESLGTLKFAQRAKMIKNKAVVNQDTQGSVEQLQAELRKLRNEMALLKANQAETMAVGGGGTPHFSAIATPGRPARPLYDTSPVLTSVASTPSLAPTAGSLAAGYAAERATHTFILQQNKEEILRLMNLLNLSSRKLRQLEQEKSRYAREILTLHEDCRRKDLSMMNLRMVRRLLQDQVRDLRSTKGLDELVDGERAMLKLEIMELEQLLRHNPEVTRFASENLQLRDQLERYQELENRSLGNEWWEMYEDDPQILADQISLLVSEWAVANATTFETPEALRDRVYNPPPESPDAADDDPAVRAALQTQDLSRWLGPDADATFQRYQLDELRSEAAQTVRAAQARGDPLPALEAKPDTFHIELAEILHKVRTHLHTPMEAICLDPKDYDPGDRLAALESAVLQSRKAAYELILEHPALSLTSQDIRSAGDPELARLKTSFHAADRTFTGPTPAGDASCLQLTSKLLGYLRGALGICEWMIDHYHNSLGGPRGDTASTRANAETIQHLETTIKSLTTQLEQVRGELVQERARRPASPASMSSKTLPSGPLATVSAKAGNRIDDNADDDDIGHRDHMSDLSQNGLMDVLSSGEEEGMYPRVPQPRRRPSRPNHDPDSDITEYFMLDEEARRYGRVFSEDQAVD
ncbi:Kinesin-like protein kif15 [Tieghemiomyces parasiticus]|uniref:Kinesin-like protein kif15 n=1 Tax=Tieghemiomyces parasiticus TaxID=78921 RepID=A0A9W8AF44_9FUNG|nr:Kinesin-like protein kif15 [Tieghemiomyces parasiticus]